jgi:hypothetical protein
LLNEVYKEVAPWGKPGYILFVQTFGDLVTFHPHIHALVADGIFVESGPHPATRPPSGGSPVASFRRFG